MSLFQGFFAIVFFICFYFYFLFIYFCLGGLVCLFGFFFFCVCRGSGESISYSLQICMRLFVICIFETEREISINTACTVVLRYCYQQAVLVY